MKKPVLLAVLVLFSFDAYAILGQKNTIRQSRLFGSRPGHVVFEQKNNISVLKEHVRSDGVVYGITWSGIAPPDVTQYLGSYAEEYKKIHERVHKRLGNRVRKIGSSKLVIEYWGHMRNLRGRIYDPNLLVDGVKPSEIE